MLYLRLVGCLLLCLIGMLGCGRTRSQDDLRAAHLAELHSLPEVFVYAETIPRVKPTSFFIECITTFDSELRKDRRERQVVRALEENGWFQTLAPEKADVIIGWRTIEGRYSEQMNIVSRPISGIVYDKYVGFYSTYLGTVTETQRTTSYHYGLTIIGHEGPGTVHREIFFLNSVVVLPYFEPEDYVPLVIAAATKSIGVDASRGMAVKILESDPVFLATIDQEKNNKISDKVDSAVAENGLLAIEGLSGESRSAVELELFKIGIKLGSKNSLLKLAFNKTEDEGIHGKLISGDRVVREFTSSRRRSLGGFDTGDPSLNCLANLILK